MPHLVTHDFRRTFASHRIVLFQFDAATVADEMGHANPATTLRLYAREFREQADRAATVHDRAKALNYGQ